MGQLDNPAAHRDDPGGYGGVIWSFLYVDVLCYNPRGSLMRDARLSAQYVFGLNPFSGPDFFILSELLLNSERFGAPVLSPGVLRHRVLWPTLLP